MVNLQIVMLSAPTSLASIMVIGPHHAAVTHAGGSTEVGQWEHMVRQGSTGKCWSEFLCSCVLVAISPHRAKWGGGGRSPRDAPGRHPSAGGPVAGAQLGVHVEPLDAKRQLASRRLLAILS